MSSIDRLRKRADFLKAARGFRWNSEHFQLQAVRRRPVDEAPARFGFTVTKKVGKATVRNRVRRRLREAVRLVAPPLALAGLDYVLIGRNSAVQAPFEHLKRDLQRGLEQVRRKLKPAAASPTGQTTTEATDG